MNRFKSTVVSQESNEELDDVTMNTQLDGRNLLDEIPGQTPQKSFTVGRSSASADDSNFRLLQQATASTHHNVTELIDNVGANLGSKVHVKVDVVEDQLDASVASGNLIIISDGGQVIDGSNQSSDNESDSSLISEQQTRNVRKSKQKVSTSGIRSSNRKQIQSTVFDYDQSNQVNGDKRKAKTESSEAAKRIKPGNDDEIQQEDEGADKYQIVTLELNCTEPGCERILNTFEMWKEHLWTCHGFVPYKHLKDNVRHNQHGQTEYPCTECNVLPKFQRSLNEHWRNFHLRGKFECSVCAFVANFRSEVKSHQQLIHRTRKFQCTHQGCDKAFKNKSELERHVRVHSGERPFKCTWDNCEFTFNQLCVATRHVRMQHFRLPQTVREQTELNIIDERDPMDYGQSRSYCFTNGPSSHFSAYFDDL